jgi:hypothetical protein
MLIPQSVLIGLVVALVGYFLQQRSWRHSKREEIRQKEFEASIEIIEGLARSFDKRIVAISEFIGRVDREDVTDDDFQEYRKSVHEWMHEFSAFKTKIYHYFRREKMLEFENIVHDSLREVSDIVLRTHKLGVSNLSREHRAEHRHARAKLDLARYNAFKFLRELNEMAANEDIGRTAFYDNVDVGSLDHISRNYLIQRLLGMKS